MATPDPLKGTHATFKKGTTALTVETLGWAIDPRGGADEYASDKTEGHMVTWPTINNYRGTVRVKVPKTGTVPFNRGERFSAEYHIDNTGNNYLKGDCVVLSEPLTVDIGADNTLEIEYEIGPRSPLVYYGIMWAGSGSSGIPNSGL